MDATLADAMKKTLRFEQQAIENVFNNGNMAAVEQFLSLLAALKGKVGVAGCGTSGAAAQKIAHTLCCSGFAAVRVIPSDALHGGLGVLQQRDLLILLSKGGETNEINYMIAPAHALGVTVVGVSENALSELARQCDLFLALPPAAEPDDLGMLATASTAAVVALFDAVTIAAAKVAGYGKERFSLVHPGGAVGKQLTGKTLFGHE